MTALLNRLRYVLFIIRYRYVLDFHFSNFAQVSFGIRKRPTKGQQIGFPGLYFQ